MDFLDEVIVQMSNKQKQKEGILNGKIYIKGELLEFEKKILFNDKLLVTLPNNFVDMPLKIAKIKYPSENRPQIIKTNLLGSINFTFNLFKQKVEPEQLEEIANKFESIVKNMNPSNIFYNKGTEDLEEIKICWFDFKGYAMDGQIYYIYYVTIINGYLLQGVFNCMINDINDYKNIAFMVMRSIKDLTGGSTNDNA